jgi:hypothetical protein
MPRPAVRIGVRTWTERLTLAVCGLAAVGILAFYAGRLYLPLPIFASDEAAYLLHALYPPEVMARNPLVATATNGVHLSLIRAVYATGAPLVQGDRIADAAAYAGGLLLLWRAATRRLDATTRLPLLALALGFPYWRFAASNLAEGPFVGVLALLALSFGRWWRAKPLAAAALTGLLGAALVLVKPNGVASLLALVAVAVADAALRRDWKRLPLQLALFAAMFFAAGNLIQWAAEEPVTDPLSFFVGPIYSSQLHAQTPPGAWRFGALSLLGMGSASLVLAGIPLVAGLADLWTRWRAEPGRFALEDADRTFLLLTLALAATLAMVAQFAIQVSSAPGERLRLWGRYFEFFAPMIWLAAAPALARPMSPAARWTAAAATMLGLAGLLAAFWGGIVLFPWDASILTAFFAPDPVRAPIGCALPLRALSLATTVLVAGAVALRARPALAGLALVVALGVLSVWLDNAWLGPMVEARNNFAKDIRELKPRVPPGPIAFLSSDVNETHLGFLTLEARPTVVLGPPAQAAARDLAGYSALVVSGAETPPGAWTRRWQGRELSLWTPAP